MSRLCTTICIPEYSLDYDLISLNNDQDVLKMVTDVPKHKLIRLCIENKHTIVLIYFNSPFKVVIEELKYDIVSLELNKRELGKREV